MAGRWFRGVGEDGSREKGGKEGGRRGRGAPANPSTAAVVGGRVVPAHREEEAMGGGGDLEEEEGHALVGCSGPHEAGRGPIIVLVGG